MQFDVNGEHKPEYVVSSDTDSLFVNIGKILEYRYPNLDLNNIDEVLPKVRPLQKEIGEKLNAYQSVLAKKLLNSDEHYFDLKPEFIFKKAYWSGKRRYAQHIVDQEGIEKDDVVMMGLDIMKSNFPAYFRNFGEQLIKDVLFGKPKTDIDKDVMAFKKSISTVDWKKLLKPTGLKKLDAYIERKPMPGEIFSKLAKKCPINTKGAIASNDILRFKKLTRQYPEFTLGDKIYLAMLKPNPYQLDVVALNGYNDAPEILELVNKYLDRDGIFDSIIRNKLDGVYSDLGWTLNLNPHASKFFQFD
jgi:hypothetical protein